MKLASLVFCVVLLSACAISADSARAAATIPAELPTDDPYLPSTDYIPPGVRPDPIHNLDTIRATWWEMPPGLEERYLRNAAAQRVIFRCTLTGAEVWLICRRPGAEFTEFYSTLHNFNANGSMLQIARFIMDVDGSNARPMDSLIDRTTDRSSVQKFIWDDKNPDLCIYKRFGGRVLRYNIRTREETPVFEPGNNVPKRPNILFSDDGSFSLIYREKYEKEPFLYVANGRGEPIREIELKSASPDPAKDRMGALRLFKDRDGKYWIVYSLNKTPSPNPHQAWLVDLDGTTYLQRASESEDAYEEKMRFLRLAGRDPLSPSMGHAGVSPSERYSIWRKGPFVSIRDLKAGETRELSYVPSADHLDWSAEVPWFLARTRTQMGLPIYRIDVPSGIAHRIVATNTSDHLACFSYSHPSPDGTKCLYRSSMLGNLDMYLSIVRYPSPPRNVEVRREGGGVLLTWEKPERSREVRGYRVYRSARSGGPYDCVSEGVVEGRRFLDRDRAPGGYYVMTAVEHSGIEGKRFSEEAGLTWDGHVNKYFEAETGKLTFPMRKVFLPASSSAAYAIARAVRDPFWQRTRGEARATWNIDLPKDASYTLWVRLRTRLGRSAEMSYLINGVNVGTFADPVPDWRWVRLSKPARLKSGGQELLCCMPKSGYELDKLLLTTDPRYTPRQMGNLPTAPPRTPSELSAAWDTTGRHVILRWRHERGPLFHYLQVHKGASKAFVPSQRTLLGSPTEPAFIDPRPPDEGELFYRIVAVDTWGNRSAVSAAASVRKPDWGPPKRLLVDLEERHLHGDLPIASNPDAAGGEHIVLDGSAKEGGVEVPLPLPPGRYLLWVRAKSKGRYQGAGWEITTQGQSQQCRVTGVARRLFSDYMWSWRRPLAKSRTSVPRWAPTWITVLKKGASLKIHHQSGYMEVDQIFLTSSVHDLPSPEAAWYKPVDAYRLKRDM